MATDLTHLQQVQPECDLMPLPLFPWSVVWMPESGDLHRHVYFSYLGTTQLGVDDRTVLP
jgi:hypothetical protein